MSVEIKGDGRASMDGFPAAITQANHVEPVPRRIRGVLADEVVFDTTRARYVWEWPYYPQYYIPLADVRDGALASEDHSKATRRGTVKLHTVSSGEVTRPGAAQVLHESELPELRDTVRFTWAALDAWFEEDEQVFVHPRSPYVRVDAIRSRRTVEIALEGRVLAKADACVMVFETGLPTRYYVDSTAVNFEHLIATDTVTACPYKGVTSGYWSVRTETGVHRDLAWTYQFPTGALLPIAGLVSFYNEKVDIHLDGVLLERPRTHFFNQ
ncbi:MAG TPA: DUF427 domain-containing protein [Solirubrobacteraceae bacterium]|nr:DUF427 domain-containing protein [Solirubrobacteraceae bacterium]